MTVTATDRRAGPFYGNGVATQFPFTFKVFSAADLEVTYTNADGVATVITSGFTVTLNADQDANPGGYITYPLTGSPMANPASLVAVGATAYTQPAGFSNVGRFLPEVHERAFDRVTILVQQLRELLQRQLTIPPDGPFPVTALPARAARYDRLLSFDDLTGQPNASPFTVTQLASTIAAAYSGAAGPLDALSFIQSGAGSVSYSPQAKARQWVTPEDKGAVGDGVTDDTDAVQAALDDHGWVYLVPGKTYLCDTLTFPAGSGMFSVGRLGKLKQGGVTGASYGMVYANSGSTSATVDSIVLDSITLVGDVASLGFSQFKHLVSLNGVRDFTAINCAFVGFQGDAVYVGSGVNSGDERHNYNIKIIACDFDGVNNDNRNGVSVIDCDGLLVANNAYRRCTRSNMPGAIDVEPDAQTFHVIRDIKIVNNRFTEIGGNVGAIGFILPDISWVTQPTAFTIAGNYIDGGAGYSTSGITVSIGGDATDARSHNAKITGNQVYRTGNGFQLNGINGLELSGNTFDTTLASPFLAAPGFATKCKNVRVSDNTFRRLGYDNTFGGGGLQVGALDVLDFTDNTWISCGCANGTFGYALDFNAGTTTYVTLKDNTFTDPDNLTTVAIQKEGAHTFTPATNTDIGTKLIGCTGNNFDALISGKTKSYTPIVAGASSAGSGTYVLQAGEYTVDQSKRVTGWAAVSVNSGHTGTGIIQISLPINAQAISGNPTIPLGGIVCSGIGTGGTPCGFAVFFNAGAVAGGVTGVARIAVNLNNDVPAGVQIPAGAFEVYINFSYVAA